MRAGSRLTFMIDCSHSVDQMSLPMCQAHLKTVKAFGSEFGGTSRRGAWQPLGPLVHNRDWSRGVMQDSVTHRTEKA